MRLIITEQEKKRILTLYGIINEQGISTSQMENPTEEPEDKSKEYPNYCKYPEYAVEPGSDDAKSSATGVDLLIDGFCLYRQPSEYETEYTRSGIWLPFTSDTRAVFCNENTYLEMYSNIIKQKESESAKLILKNLDKQSILEQLQQLWVPGTVYRFSIDGVNYQPAYSYAVDLYRIVFAGYYAEGRVSKETKYINPTWDDTRSEAQRIFDDWSTTIGFVAMAIGIGISFYFTGPAAIIAEMIFNLSVATPFIIRNTQKGEYTSATIDFISAWIPLLRLSPKYKGFTSQEFKELVELMSGKGDELLRSNNTKLTSIYDNLSDRQKKLLYQLLNEDEYHLQKMVKQIAKDNPEEFEKFVLNELKNISKTNPSQFGKKAFWDSLFGKELQVGGGELILGMFGPMALGWAFDAEDKEVLDGLELSIPDRYKPDVAVMLYGLGENPMKSFIKNKEAMKEVERNLFQVDLLSKQLSGVYDTNLVNRRIVNIMVDTINVTPQSVNINEIHNDCTEKNLEEIKEEGWVEWDIWLDGLDSIYNGRKVKEEKCFNDKDYVLFVDSQNTTKTDIDKNNKDLKK